MYKCINCGAGLEFDPKIQKLKCSYCGGEFEPEIFEEKENINATENKKMEDEKDIKDETFDVFIYRCPQCGAELMTTEETAATFCSYCGTSVLLESRVGRQQKPSYIIPFKMTKEECEILYREKLKKYWFAPKNMAEEEKIEKFRGIYMPYWVYTLEKKGAISASGSSHYRLGDYVYHDKYDIQTSVDATYEGITFDASSNFYDNLSWEIAPYNTEEGKEFSPSYLSGFYADVGDVDSTVYEDNAQEIMGKDIIDRIKNQKINKRYNAKFSNDYGIEVKSGEMGFFPVWFLASKNKKGDRISYAAINGQTGKVAVEVPIDFKKYVIVTLFVALPIFIMLNLFVTLTPTIVMLFSIITSIIGLVITNVQLNKVHRRRLRLEDEGYMYRHEDVKYNNESKMSLDEKMKTIISPIIAIVILIVIFLIHPVSDEYYYIGAMISSIFTFKAFRDIIKLHNILNSRELPQLDKRGGN